MPETKAMSEPPSINAVDPSAQHRERRHRASEETDAEALSLLPSQSIKP